ncbi:TPA: FimD/PapC N-terminal domain-containing protein, partial [Providencia alcalifaciens]
MAFLRDISLITVSGIVLLSAPVNATNEDASEALTFDSDFLGMGNGGAEKHVDLSYFAHKGGMAPGDYAVQVNVNSKRVDEGRVLTFKSWPDQPGKLYACVSAEELLTWWGIQSSSTKG